MLFKKEIHKTSKEESGTVSTEITTKEVLFKDKENINHRNITEYLSNIELLAGTIRDPNGYDVTTSLLWDTSVFSSIEHEPNHNGCEPFGLTESVTRVTEKRMCKCMYYFNSKVKDQEMCNRCKLDCKWKNVGDIEIIDCEVPTKLIIKSVGGADLILQTDSGKIYSTEVKPQGSSETLVRMMAEAFTIIAVGGPKDYSSCHPAICFFKDSKNMMTFSNQRFGIAPHSSIF